MLMQGSVIKQGLPREQKLVKIVHIVDLLKIWKHLGFFTLLNVLYGLSRNRPIHIPLGSEKYLVNPEAATTYHLANSLSKLNNLVDAIPDTKASVILDVGANCGLFSVLAAKRFPSARIYAFEPAPDLSALAQKNLEMHNGTVIQKAVSSVSGKTTLFVNDKSQQTNSIVQDAVTAVGNISRKYDVETVSLDDFIKAERIENIDVLKIDIQGAESDLLSGATETLQKTRALIIEVTFLDPNVQELMRHLSRYFSTWQPINPVLFGADILLLRNGSNENGELPEEKG